MGPATNFMKGKFMWEKSCSNVHAAPIGLGPIFFVEAVHKQRIIQTHVKQFKELRELTEYISTV